MILPLFFPLFGRGRGCESVWRERFLKFSFGLHRGKGVPIGDGERSKLVGIVGFLGSSCYILAVFRARFLEFL